MRNVSVSGGVVLRIARFGIVRNVALCADNRLVLHCLRKNKAKDGEPSRLAKFIIDVVIENNVAIPPPIDLQSNQNVPADGLTRWSESEIMDRLHLELMAQIGEPSEWFRAIHVVYNNAVGPPLIVERRGQAIRCFRDRSNKVCEWRPGCYAATGLLWAGGVAMPSVRDTPSSNTCNG